MINPYDDIYETRNSSPLWWFNKSSDLHASAGALWLSMEVDNKDAIRLGLGKNFSMNVACWPVYQMLFGMAFELVFKAIMVAKKEQPDHIHNLEDLAHKTGIEFLNEELSILKVLTEAIIWDGRYPIPKKKERLEKHFRHAGNIIHGTGKQEGASLSWEDLDRIWGKGKQEFFAVYKSPATK